MPKVSFKSTYDNFKRHNKVYFCLRIYQNLLRNPKYELFKFGNRLQEFLLTPKLLQTTRIFAQNPLVLGAGTLQLKIL